MAMPLGLRNYTRKVETISDLASLPSPCMSGRQFREPPVNFGGGGGVLAAHRFIIFRVATNQCLYRLHYSLEHVLRELEVLYLKSAKGAGL